MNMPSPHTPSPASLAWAQRLVQFDTRSEQSNLPLIECIADHLRSLQVPLRLTWDESRRKANLFATLGTGKPGGVVLSGHTDTVPWDGQAWTADPLSGQVKAGRLYGRGSADMKGFIGLVVAQTQAFLDADLPHALHYAFSYDEEVGGFGAMNLIADLRDAGIAPPICIVGEPTDMVPAIAHKGVHRWRCCVRGKAAHSSLTPQAVNAVEAAARLVAHIAAIGDELRDTEPRQSGFDVPYSTSAVCRFEGGIADNVVPESCRVVYEFRDLPGADAAALQRQLGYGRERFRPRPVPLARRPALWGAAVFAAATAARFGERRAAAAAAQARWLADDGIGGTVSPPHCLQRHLQRPHPCPARTRRATTG
jgi:acetylornithine deacetylase